jgi:hypothetical protein
MWVDQQAKRDARGLDENKVDKTWWKICKIRCLCAGLESSTTTDLSAYAILSEPMKNMSVILKFTRPKRYDWKVVPKKTACHNQYWADQGYIIATPGNVIDYFVIMILSNLRFNEHKVSVSNTTFYATQPSRNYRKRVWMFPSFHKLLERFRHPQKSLKISIPANKTWWKSHYRGCSRFLWSMRMPMTIWKVHKGRLEQMAVVSMELLQHKCFVRLDVNAWRETNESIYNQEDTEFTS